MIPERTRSGILWWGVLLLIFILPANGMVTPFLSDTLATVFGALKDAIILGLFALVVVTGRIRLVPVPIVILVGMIVTLGALSAIWTPSLTQAAYGWRNDFLPFLVLVVVPAVVERRHLPILTTAMIVALQLAAATTIVTWNRGLQWLFTLGIFPVAPDADFPSSLFVAGSIVPRGFSPYSAPNENAVATTIALAVLWTRPRVPIWVKGALTALPLVAVYLTQSRSGYIGLGVLAVALVGWALFRRRPMLVWAMLTVTAAAAVAGATLYLYIDKVVSHVADPSLIGHSDSLFDNIPFLISHPFGIGLGQVGPRALLFSPDAVLVESFFLVLAIESGVIVMGLFAALVVYLFVRGIRAGTLDGFLPAAAVAGAFVSFTVLPTLQEGPVAYTLWIVCGMGVVASRAVPGTRLAGARKSAASDRGGDGGDRVGAGRPGEDGAENGAADVLQTLGSGIDVGGRRDARARDDQRRGHQLAQQHRIRRRQDGGGVDDHVVEASGQIGEDPLHRRGADQVAGALGAGARSQHGDTLRRRRD